MAYKDITGQKFGRLLVLEKIGFSENPRRVIWRCKCDCGNICEVTSNLLLDNKKRSCGCLRAENNRKRIGAAHAKIGEYNIQNTNIIKINQKKSKNNKSGKRGVCYDKSAGRYKAYISFQKKRYNLGSFSDFISAAKARDEAENRIYGDFLKWYQETYPEQWEKLKGGK